MVEDDLRWKTTFGERGPSLEDNLRWKTTYGGRQPSAEDDLRQKTTFGGRQPLVEDNLWWKTTFGGRQLLEEDDPCMLPSPLCGIFYFAVPPSCPKIKFHPEKNNFFGPQKTNISRSPFRRLTGMTIADRYLHFSFFPLPLLFFSPSQPFHIEGVLGSKNLFCESCRW